MAKVGVHYILELFDCAVEKLDDPHFVRDALTRAAEIARSTLLDQVSHRFHPQGVTALALLAESHISVHTWPETGYAAADIFTCGDATRPADACDFLVRAFEAGSHHIRRLNRGATTPNPKEEPRWQVPRYVPISG